MKDSPKSKIILLEKQHYTTNSNTVASPESNDLLQASNFNSTGTNREWALETLLKEEKINVKNLEDRNKALKDRIQNLEVMLKSSYIDESSINNNLL